MKVAQVLFTGATLASIASTNGLAASMLRLNAAMRANPIGIIVTAIGLLVAGFIVAYKKSETFRNVVAIVAKAVLSYVAFMIRAWGEMITIIMKVITGPMRLFLGVMSKLPGVGDAAKAGLKLVNGAIEGVGNFAEKTANKVEGLKAKVDAFTAAANKAAKNDTTKKDEKSGGPAASTRWRRPY
jgi:phage-related protein